MDTNSTSVEKTGKTAAAGYYPALFLLSLLWIVYYNPFTCAAEIISFTAQQAAVFTLLQVCDTAAGNRRIRFTLAGTAALYIFLLHLNALLLSITSMTLYESLTVLAAGGDFLYTLQEAGLSTGFILVLVLILAAVFSAGGFACRYMPRMTFTAAKGVPALASLSAACIILFCGEQVIDRNSPGFFMRRAFPLYVEIFSENRDSMTFSTEGFDPPAPGSFGSTMNAANPGNVVFILLESFRADSINPALAPVMTALSEGSFIKCRYYTDAIYTSLAWNTILMDRPPFTLSQDISFDRSHGYGSPVFRVFKKAGYETYMASSANMEWKNFRSRINGREGLIDNYFCGYRERNEERNIIDRRTCDRTVEWIKTSGKKPFFMFVQLDSSHWTYYADEENRISKPYAGRDVNIAKLRNQGDIELLHNRYRNSVRQVDAGISRIIAAIKERGIDNKTAIVIVSDHGEGFAPGMIGHSVLHDDIRKPAFIMVLPAVTSSVTDRFMTHMDIFPTLFRYLSISGTEKIMQGRPVLPVKTMRDCALTFHGSLMMAELTFSDYSVFFRVKQSGSTITFTPAGFKDRAGRTMQAPDNRWKERLREIMTPHS